MSKQFLFDLATEKDDAELRGLARGLAMEGPMRIAFAKEPNFFAAERVGSVSLDVIACREQESRRIVGFGTRSVRRVFINGIPRFIGYLASLRGIPEVRGRTLLARAYKTLRQFHESDKRVPFYFTTILDDNKLATRVLTSGRAGLPTYKEVGLVHTYMVSARSRVRMPESSLIVRRGSFEMLEKIVLFLNQYNAQYQFAPAFEISDFLENNFFPGFRPEDFLLVFCGNELLGVAGIWNQRAVKQVLVAGYDKRLKKLRPFYNLGAWLRRVPSLPKSGDEVRVCYGAFVAIKDRNPEFLLPLLNAFTLECRRRQYSSILLGLNEQDPLNEVVRSASYRTIRSRVYGVFWEDGKPEIERLDDRMTHLEIATL